MMNNYQHMEVLLVDCVPPNKFVYLPHHSRQVLNNLIIPKADYSQPHLAQNLSIEYFIDLGFLALKPNKVADENSKNGHDAKTAEASNHRDGDDQRKR
jgi:hypothetical protein